METNTTIISLEEYNRLRDFMLNTTKGMVRYSTYSCRGGGEIEYLSKDDAIKKAVEKETSKLTEMNKNCNKEMESLRTKLDEYGDKCKELSNTIINLENPKEKETTLDDIKNMSYWEFRKWKNKL